MHLLWSDGGEVNCVDGRIELVRQFGTLSSLRPRTSLDSRKFHHIERAAVHIIWEHSPTNNLIRGPQNQERFDGHSAPFCDSIESTVGKPLQLIAIHRSVVLLIRSTRDPISMEGHLFFHDALLKATYEPVCRRRPSTTVFDGWTGRAISRLFTAGTRGPGGALEPVRPDRQDLDAMMPCI